MAKAKKKAAKKSAKKKGGKVVALVGYDGGALRTMADASVIVPRANDGHTSTPHVEGFHEVYHHLICERCGTVVEIPACEIEGWAVAAARRRGFTVVAHQADIVGRCPRCA